jgi:hypothetical protein
MKAIHEAEGSEERLDELEPYANDERSTVTNRDRWREIEHDPLEIDI